MDLKFTVIKQRILLIPHTLLGTNTDLIENTANIVGLDIIMIYNPKFQSLVRDHSANVTSVMVQLVFYT